MAARKKDKAGNLILTANEESFCQAMILAKDKSEAFKLSKYSSDNMKPETINAQACHLSNLPHISARVAELMVERNKRLEIDADYVLKRLIEIDQMDIADIINDDLSVKPISEWPGVWRKTISSVEVVEQVAGKGDDAILSFIKKLKLPDKVKNLELIGKHVDVQAWSDKVELGVNLSMTIDDLSKKIANERIIN